MQIWRKIYMNKLKFSKNFWWGAATSGPQSEGRFNKKNRNIFDYWYDTDKKAFFDEIGPNVASNFYNSYKEDIIDATAQKNSVRRIGNTEYTDIDSYHIKKEGDMDLNNIARNALKKANKILVEGVLPYDFAKAVQ